jgi:hypothetical protein
MSGQATPIRLSDALAGMVLATDLRDAGGAVLLPAGTALSAASLASLGRRGVEELSVLAVAAAPSEAQNEAERLRRCARLARLFRHSATVEASGVLLAYLLRYRNGGRDGDGH